METINISLPPEMARYVRRQAAHTYGNISEFFRALVRAKIEAEVAQDLALLRDATQGAPAGPTDAEIAAIIKAQKAVRKSRA
jgi:Arc/MetJ-type ribon-helix-helix transcriptional regulator